MAAIRSSSTEQYVSNCSTHTAHTHCTHSDIQSLTHTHTLTHYHTTEYSHTHTHTHSHTHTHTHFTHYSHTHSHTYTLSLHMVTPRPIVWYEVLWYYCWTVTAVFLDARHMYVGWNNYVSKKTELWFLSFQYLNYSRWSLQQTLDHCLLLYRKIKTIAQSSYWHNTSIQLHSNCLASRNTAVTVQHSSTTAPHITQLDKVSQWPMCVCVCVLCGECECVWVLVWVCVWVCECVCVSVCVCVCEWLCVCECVCECVCAAVCTVQLMMIWCAAIQYTHCSQLLSSDLIVVTDCVYSVCTALYYSVSVEVCECVCDSNKWCDLLCSEWVRCVRVHCHVSMWVPPVVHMSVGSYVMCRTPAWVYWVTVL